MFNICLSMFKAFPSFSQIPSDNLRTPSDTFSYSQTPRHIVSPSFSQPFPTFHTPSHLTSPSLSQPLRHPQVLSDILRYPQTPLTAFLSLPDTAEEIIIHAVIKCYKFLKKVAFIEIFLK